MEKVSIDPANKFCPQALFIYGTNKKDGSPNFGTFTWFSYCWDSELCVMASIGDGKLTIDRIRESRIFSANLVTEPILPIADYLGNNAGYTSNKMDIPIEVERGKVLDVPVLKNSPWVYELEVKQSIPLNGNEVFICKIQNVLVAKELTDESKSAEERMKLTAPVIWIGAGPYFPVNPVAFGLAGDWKDLFNTEK
jgi:flavin reductase (DIM6/NTAB) family NADH-FMN oxidoreductase RutF